MTPSVITKTFRTLVRPHGETPSGNLPLSPLDKIPLNNRVADVVQVFTYGHQPAKVIREALSRALDHYYPLAGRLVETAGGDLEVACTSDGAWFIEASADCTLKDVNFLKLPLMISEEDILPHPRPGVDPDYAVVMIQVTEFTCGGFAVGYLMNHVMYDGIGQWEFIKAIGEMARGLTKPTALPIWSRASIPGQPRFPRELTPFSDSILDYAVIDVSLDNINQLKRQFKAQTGRSCTTFQVLGAKLWQSWTRAVGHDPQLPVTLAYAVDIRPLLRQQGILPDGNYYGNCVYLASADVPSGKIAEASIVEVVDLIRDATERVPIEFWKWASGKDPPLPVTGDVLCLSDWRTLGYNEVDYGWGPPPHTEPSTAVLTVPFSGCGIANPPVPLKGARLHTVAVTKEKMATFLHQMMCQKPSGHITSAL